MNLTLARELVQKRGYQLDLRESEWRQKTICRLYAVNGDREHFLCNLTGLIRLSTATFQHKIAQLPGKSEEAS